MIKKRSKRYWNRSKSQNISTFLINFDFFNLLINSFDLLIHFDRSFNQKRDKKWLILLKNRLKLNQNCNHRLKIVIGIGFELKSSSEFVGIWIGIVNNSIRWSASPKLTVQPTAFFCKLSHFYLHSETFWNIFTCFNTSSIIKLTACFALFETFFHNFAHLAKRLDTSALRHTFKFFLK